jgi:transposase
MQGMRSAQAGRVAEHLGVSWNLVKELLKEALRRRFGRPRLKDLRLLAIDEISIGRGHRYLTVVLDLETGAVVFVGEGKGAEALGPFWKRLKSAGACIEAVAIDMSQAYINAVRAHLPRATLVFDHFHVVKLMNDKLSDLRRELQRQAESEEKEVLKGTRWLSLHRAGILAYYDVPISTGPLEGTNNKIKTLQRQAYGYRDQEFFRPRIFALHETHYELVG